MDNLVVVRRDVPDGLTELAGLHPLLQKIYQARDITTMADISRELSALLPFDQLTDIHQAALRLFKSLQQREHIMIIGDFDADGATSTALAVSALRQFGAQHVSYLVPNRFTYGYGLTADIVKVAEQQKPDLIITVDNGISSHDGVDRANASGIDVIVTDHHLAGDTLPNACAIVNPNQPDDVFASKCIAGVGVIFYVMLALRALLKSHNWFATHNIPCPNMAEYLDLVALGTVADVVKLDKNNRIMVHQGLRRIRSLRMRPGIAALLEIAHRNPKQVRASDLGFSVGPRLNAAGRLDDMSLGIACLLAEDSEKAQTMAKQLDDLNKERRLLENQMKAEAFQVLDQLHLSDNMPVGVCLYRVDWHQGVVGLVAARVKEKLYRPVIAFARSDDNSLKGSARSIAGLHIRDVIAAIDTQNPGLITKFGGHAMAAGLSLPLQNFTRFSECFDQEVKARLAEDNLLGELYSDGELQSAYFNLEMAELLRNAGPWGQGFPEPLFDGVFNLMGQRVVGQRHLKCVLKLPTSDDYLDGIMFNIDLEQWPNHHCRLVDVVYRLDVNDFNNRRRLQLVIEKMHPH